MASSINAITTGVGGIVSTGDNSGNLDLQSGGVTKIAVTSAGVAVTGLSKASLPTGSVLQVVSAVYSTTVSSSTNTFIDTGLTASITPTSATSKILIIANVNGLVKTTGNTGVATRLLKDSTVLTNMEGIAGFTNATTPSYNGVGSSSVTYLDSPATTSSTAYKVQFCSSDNVANVSINEFHGTGRSISTITLMEIAA